MLQFHLDCMPCFASQALDAVSMVTEETAVRLRVMRRVLREISDFPLHASPLLMGARIHRLVRQETGSPDPYRQVKDRANAFALQLVPGLQKRIAESADPFETALRVAVAGNIMDWGARHHTHL